MTRQEQLSAQLSRVTVLTLAVAGGCGRLGFTPVDETLELDAPVSGSAGAGLAYAQPATMVSTDVDAIVSFPRSVSSGSALVVSRNGSD